MSDLEFDEAKAMAKELVALLARFKGETLISLMRRCATAESRISEALSFCEDRQDTVDGEFGPLPNLAMQVATILKGRAP